MENIVEPERPHVTTWRMRILCQMPKATETHSEYVRVLLIAFPPQKWLQEGASVLRLNICTWTDLF